MDKSENNKKSSLSKFKIHDYLTISTLGLISPLALGVYLTKIKKVGDLVPNVTLGMLVGIVLGLGGIKYDNLKVGGINNDSINVSYRTSYISAEEISSNKEMDHIKSVGSVALSNYKLFDMIINKKENPLTEISVFPMNWNLKINCKYVFDGFKRIEDLDIGHPYEIKAGTNEINNEEAFKFYKYLCNETFEKEKENLEFLALSRGNRF